MYTIHTPVIITSPVCTIVNVVKPVLNSTNLVDLVRDIRSTCSGNIRPVQRTLPLTG